MHLNYTVSVMVDTEIIQWLLTEINENSKKLKNNTCITENELRCFIAIIYLSGYLELPRRRLMWEQSPDCHNNLVSNAIRRDKFEYILSNFFSSDEKNDNIKITELNVRVNHKLYRHCPIENQFNIADIPIDDTKAFRILCGTSKSGFCNFLSIFTSDKEAQSVIRCYAKFLKQFRISEIEVLFDNSFSDPQFLYEINCDVVGVHKRTRACAISNLSGIEKLRTNVNLYRSRIRGHKIFARYFTFFLDVILYNAFLLLQK
ncbi:hypothetical protein NQ314_007101 [Rhamnusium bicolor]|uniref:PiggyBac transposable element-derived protein domain-containing protein n=1 Tax=Rhamnusium bicolor TaxID=1586634 RepID=A0AAV8YSU8_9CUCU|nr:hypothetical protein NQ314_007101 [Rhamnusium bicolor]